MFDLFFFLLGAVLVIAVLVSPILSIVAMRRTGRLRHELTTLGNRVGAMEFLGKGSDPRSADEAGKEEAAHPSAAIAAITASPPTDHTPVFEDTPKDSASEERMEAPEKMPAPAAPQPKPKRAGIEEAMTSRWLVWLGSVTIALGGIFLVKYSIDQNLLSPSVRIFLGCLLGFGLAIGGEWLRRQPLQRAIASVRPNQIPPALTAAGVAVAFGSIYAGYGLYHLFAPLVAFGLLSLVAVGALGLSLLQGPFVAGLGILGAFAIPLLVTTGNPSAWGLFSFVLFIAANALAVVRYKNWWWLAWLSLAGSALWEFVWLVALWREGDALPLAMHLIAMLVLYSGVRYESVAAVNPRFSHPFDFTRLAPPQALAVGVAVVGSGIGFLLVHADGFGGVSLFTMGLIVSGFVAVAYRFRVFEGLLLLGAVTALATLATWHIQEITQFPRSQLVIGLDLTEIFSPLTALQLAAFSEAALGVGLLFGVAGFIGVVKSRTHGLWAAVSGVVPLAVLAVSYWRMDVFGADFLWAFISLGLGAVAVVAAAQIAKRRTVQGMETALGMYAIAVIAAISLGAAIALEETWLTIVLAVQLPAAAWVHVRFGIPHLRPASLAVAIVVGARLVLLHFQPGSPLEVPMGAGWILYSYGIPAVAFGLAAHWFRETADDRLVTVLEAGTVALGVALVNMEIRHFVGSATFWFDRYDLLEQSLQAISWLATGYWLYRRQRIQPRLVHMWSARILITLAALQVIFLQAGISNPLLTGVDVWSAPVFNLLLLAYGMPALFALLVHREALQQGHRAVAKWAGVLALGLIFLNLSMEVRHLFHGNYLDIGPMTVAEGYTYSVAWLVYAGVLLGLGIAFGVVQLRHASLGMILLVVAKVFLWDMAWLTGLYRVGSFLGLGGSLVAVGYLYQRYVFRLHRDEISPPSE